MEIYTDTSIDDRTQTAGIGCVFVSPFTQTIDSSFSPDKELDEFVKYTHRYVKDGSSQTGELLAIHFALSQIPKDYKEKGYLYTDSKDALVLIHRMLYKPYRIKKTIQAEVLSEICKIFKENPNLSVQFCHVRGHESFATLFSYGYYNGKADERALIGRDIGVSLLKAGQRYAHDDIFQNRISLDGEYEFIKDFKGDWKKRIVLCFEVQNPKKSPKKVCHHNDKAIKRSNGKKRYHIY